MDRARPFAVQVRVMAGDGSLVRVGELRWEETPTAAEVLAELCERAAAARRAGHVLVVVSPEAVLVLLRAVGLLAPAGPLADG